VRYRLVIDMAALEAPAERTLLDRVAKAVALVKQRSKQINQSSRQNNITTEIFLSDVWILKAGRLISMGLWRGCAMPELKGDADSRSCRVPELLAISSYSGGFGCKAARPPRSRTEFPVGVLQARSILLAQGETWSGSQV